MSICCLPHSEGPAPPPAKCWRWRWVFWINVPLIVEAWLAARWVLPRTSDLPAPHPLDLPGVVYLVPGLALLFLALHAASHVGSSLMELAGYSLGAAVCLIGLIRRELRTPAPLLYLALIRQRPFAAGSVAGLLGAGQGMIIAPNNRSVRAVAGPGEKGPAGGLINLIRSLGMSLGISLGSILLSGGSRHVTVLELLHGSRLTWFVLAGIALVAAILSGLRASPRPLPSTGSITQAGR